MTEYTHQHRLAEDMLALGVRPGSALLVHSSLSALGYVPGGPETVILGLLEALGPEGTLLLPALSYATVHAANPVFDVARTPSCIGVIPEHFRTRPGTLRSVNPTHSMGGVGPQAAALLGEHHLDDTPCGPHSPWRKLPAVDGSILFLGCGLRPNTSMHAVEEVAQPPYLFGPTLTYRIIHADGRETTMSVRRHNFSGYRQRYDRIALVHEGGWIRQGQVLQAEAHLVRAAPMWEAALAAYARDPLFFVERSV